MINFKKIFILALLCIFIFTFNLSKAISHSLNNFDIRTNEISKFVPEDNELLFYSNYKNNEIKKFIKQRFTDNEIKKLNMMKNGLISFLGFNIKDNLSDIYDGEFILSTFKKTNKKREILIIIKAKNERDLNRILNIEDNDYNINQLVEISRPKTLNFLTYIIQTNDNFIICASNKDLIYNSLKAINNNKLKKIREKKFNYYKSKLKDKKLFLYTNKQFYDSINISPFNFKDINYLTQFYFDKNKLVLNSFSFNIDDKLLVKNNLNFPEKNDLILLTNEINSYKNLLSNTVENYFDKELFEDISKIIKDKIFFKINNSIWTLGFKSLKNPINLGQLTSLNDFQQDKFKNNNNIYTIFSKNKLEFIDEQFIYKSEKPIFAYESNNITFLSNDFSELINTLNTLNIDDIFQSKSSNLITDNNLIIRDFNNQIYKDFLNIFDSLNYFTLDGFSLKLDTFESKTTQKIPEIIPQIEQKTYINFS